jgi:hypothetical protein
MVYRRTKKDRNSTRLPACWGKMYLLLNPCPKSLPTQLNMPEGETELSPLDLFTSNSFPDYWHLQLPQVFCHCTFNIMTLWLAIYFGDYFSTFKWYLQILRGYCTVQYCTVLPWVSGLIVFYFLKKRSFAHDVQCRHHQANRTCFSTEVVLRHCCCCYDVHL